MRYLSHAEARQFAESLWGTGGTQSEKTNTPHAYYFSCSAHGGFIIDARTLPAGDVEVLKEITQPEVCQHYVLDGQVVAFNWPHRRRNRRVAATALKINFEVFVLEEDCAWCLAYLFTGIRFKNEPAPGHHMQHAKETYRNWYDMSNPVVANRVIVDSLRARGDDNLIISAINVVKDGDEQVVRVTTADQKTHLVTDYDKCRDQYGTPWLSGCRKVMLMAAG